MDNKRVILYNDNVHEFLDIVNQIVKATNQKFDTANQLATAIRINGKFPIYYGTINECEHIISILNEINLKTDII